MKKINTILFFFYLITFPTQGWTIDLNVKYMASMCSSCHIPDKNVSDVIPSLVGYDKKKFLVYFNNLKNSNDNSEIMYQIAQGYTTEEIKKLAEFFSHQY